MSNTIQNINDITPLKDNQSGAEDEVQAEYLEGKKFLERNETSQAAASFHNALMGYEERNDENGVANAVNQLGNVCFLREDYDKALEHYGRAEEICRKHKDPLSLLLLTYQIVEVFRKKGEYKEAISRCLDMLDFYQANNNPKGTVELLERIAEIYIESGDREAAADAYKTISSIHKNYNHTRMADDFLQKANELMNG